MALLIVSVISWGSFVGAATPVGLSVWIAWWDQARGLDVLRQHLGEISSVSPYWYVFQRDGTVVALPNADAPDLLGLVHAAGLTLIPTIANADPQTNQKDPQLALSVLTNPATRARHLASILETARSGRYDGIELDYENMPAVLRDTFTRFVEELAAALHAEGRLLVVTLQPKVRDPGGENGSQALDYAAIGAAADLLRVTAYDYSWDASDPGPVAPLPWVEQVITFAVSQIPPERLQLGVAFYGYDWVDGRGTSRMWDELHATAVGRRATVRWDVRSGSPWFEYVGGDGRHEVWFENADSLAHKLALIRRLGLAGLSAWRLGGEDPEVWTLFSAVHGGAPDAIAPRRE